MKDILIVIDKLEKIGMDAVKEELAKLEVSQENIEKIESFLKEQTIHKLSWRWWGNQSDSNMNIYTSEGKLTYFGYLYENYLLKNK